MGFVAFIAVIVAVIAFSCALVTGADDPNRTCSNHFSAALTTMVPLIVRPWTLQWYLNSPSLSNLTGFDDFPGSTEPVSNVLPSSSETAVCDVRDSLVQITESPMLSCSSFGSKLKLF